MMKVHMTLMRAMTHGHPSNFPTITTMKFKMRMTTVKSKEELNSITDSLEALLKDFGTMTQIQMNK